MKNDGMTKYQRYNKKHPVISFRGDTDMKIVLENLAKRYGKSTQKFLYDIVSKELQESYNVKIVYQFTEEA